MTRLNVQSTGGKLSFHVPWIGKFTYFFLVAGAVWSVFFGPLLFAKHVQINDTRITNPITIFFIGFVFISPGLFLLILALVRLVTKRLILVSNHYIFVKDRPSWFRSTKRYSISEIANISAQSKSNVSINGISIFVHFLQITFVSKETRKLCRTISHNEAAYLERILNDFLRLPHRESLLKNEEAL